MNKIDDCLDDIRNAVFEHEELGSDCTVLVNITLTGTGEDNYTVEITKPEYKGVPQGWGKVFINTATLIEIPEHIRNWSKEI